MKIIESHKPFLHVLLIILISLIAYSNTFNSPFYFDDEFVIVKNPIVKNLEYFFEPSKANIFKGHFEYATFKLRYIGYLTFALNYKLHGLNVAGYHIFNIFTHITTSLFVYLLVSMSFKTPFLLSSRIKEYSRYIAFFTALFFASHPIQTQAVTYIWQRVTSLATLLYLLSLVSYIKWRLISQNPEFGHQTSDRRQKNVKLKSILWYLIAVFSAVLAMRTKEIAFMLPPTIFLYELLFFKAKWPKKIIFLIPIFLTMLIVPLTMVKIDSQAGQLIDDVSEKMRGNTPLSRWEYLITSFRVIVTYIRLIFLPVNQNLDYDFPVFRSFFDIQVFMSVILLAAICGLGVYLLLRYRNSESHTRLISFGIFWFFINLALESSVIPLNNVIYEHRLYLPSIGVFITINVVIFVGIERWKNKFIAVNKIAFITLTMIIVMLTAASFERNRVWKDEISLWSDVIKKGPNKARGYNNLGNAYRNQGFIEKAIEQYQIALRIDPNFQDAHYNLGHAYQYQGLNDNAIEQYQAAIKINPADTESRNNLGNAYQAKGLIDMAIKQYQMALRVNPYHLDSRINLGNAYISKGDTDRAIEQYQIAIKQNPDTPSAHYNLGMAYQSKGLLKKAIEHYQTAIRLDPYEPSSYYNLGRTYRAMKFDDMAIENYRNAIKLRPDWALPHYELGNISFEKGDREDAMRELKKALQIDPSHNEARQLLNSLYH